VKIDISTLFIEYAAKFEDNADILSQEQNREDAILVDSSLSD
jgi:hypothetical protein